MTGLTGVPLDKRKYRSRVEAPLKSPGWKIFGAAGGGYLVLVSDKPVENAVMIRIR